jgi:hypothetical protein
MIMIHLLSVAVVMKKIIILLIVVMEWLAAFKVFYMECKEIIPAIICVEKLSKGILLLIL